MAGNEQSAIPREQRRRRPGQLSGGPHGLSREQVAAHQRARITAAMSSLVAEQGYEPTSVGQIISRAGVSRKTFYELDGGREQWFVALCDQTAQRLLDRLELACQQGRDRRERAERVATALVDLCVENPAAARACFIETLAAGEAARSWRAGLLDRLTATLGRATRGERSPEGNELAARAAVGAILELAGRHPQEIDRKYATSLVATILTAGGATT